MYFSTWGLLDVDGIITNGLSGRMNLLDTKSLLNLESAIVHLLLSHGVKLEPNRILTRCVVCNGSIEPVRDEDRRKDIFKTYQAPDEVVDEGGGSVKRRHLTLLHICTVLLVALLLLTAVAMGVSLGGRSSSNDDTSASLMDSPPPPARLQPRIW